MWVFFIICVLVSSPAAGPRWEQRKPPSQESVKQQPSPLVGFDPHEFQSAAEQHPITQQAGSIVIKHSEREGGGTSPRARGSPLSLPGLDRCLRTQPGTPEAAAF